MKIIKAGLVLHAVILVLNISLLSGCAKSKPSQEKTNIIKIGIAQALSGPIDSYGESIRKGILLAINRINGQEYLGEGKKIQLIVEDTEGDQNQAKNAFKKLITKDKVVAIIGPTSSNSAFAAYPIAQDAGIPVIGSSTVVPGITDIGEYIFRVCLADSVVISKTISALVEKRDMSRVAVMYCDTDEFTLNTYKYFSKALNANNVTILTTETFTKGDSDFSTQLKNIKSLNPQAIILSGLAEDAANIMIQAQGLGITEAYFVGGNSFNTSRLTRIAGKAAEGAISGIAWFLKNETPENKQFVIDFGATYAVDPDQFSAHAYTAVLILAEAIRRAGSSDPAGFTHPGAIRDQLARIKDFPTPLGKFSFRANREPLYEPAILIVKNTVFSLFDK